jgi:CheY-like chemotaxis protein
MEGILTSHEPDRTVLYIVDDEPMLLELAAVILEPLGYEVWTFRDPVTAIAAFSKANPPPALIITDYAMHSMNGLQLVQACRRIRPEQKALLISGTVDEDFFRNDPCQPDEFLAKPYKAKQLADLVSALVE